MKEFLPEGSIISSEENKKYYSNISALKEAILRKTVIEANALICDADHNLFVDLGNIKAIIPRDEGAIGISNGKTRDIALISRVGKPVCFTVTDILEENGIPTVYLSRKNAQELCLEHFSRIHKTGDIIDAKITHLESFGAFCDIGCGNVALLPIDSISVSRISHPRDRFKIGENIKAVIKSIAPDGKVTLSHKELLGTWEENAQFFAPGQTVTGVVRSIESYGIFIELAPNLAGLAEPREDVWVGQQASVFIKSVIPEKMKIKLIIIDNFDAKYSPKIKYFYEGDKISEWNYSPGICSKQISSNFESA